VNSSALSAVHFSWHLCTLAEAELVFAKTTRLGTGRELRGKRCLKLFAGMWKFVMIIIAN
jgi:hypothetical protein